MRQLTLALAATLGLVSVAAAGNIDGKVAGWSGNLFSQPLAVVWLEAVRTPATSKDEPVMAQRGGQFVPSFLVIVAGQTVNMPNEDEVAHNVYSVSAAKEFNLGYYARGDPKTVTFDRPGMVEVQCLLHSFMRARILVVPNPYYSKIAADGSFHIRNAPAGKYALTFWGDGMASFSEEVDVPAGGKPLTVRLPLPAATPQK
jgi:plastocyanin